MATHEQVAFAFTRGEKAKGSKTDSGAYRMFTADNVVYSYGPHYPLAKRILPKAVIINVCPSSVSTAKHRSKVRQAIPSDWAVLECDDLQAEWELESTDFAQALFDYHKAQIEEAQAKQAKARAPRMRDMWERKAKHHAAQISLYWELVGGAI